MVYQRGVAVKRFFGKLDKTWEVFKEASMWVSLGFCDNFDPGASSETSQV
jgi:hypothetical protein